MGFEAYGVPVRVEFDDQALSAQMETILPPIRGPLEAGDDAATFSVTTGQDGTLSIHAQSSLLISGASAQVALGLLDAQIRMHVASTTTERVFVHAGVVAIEGNALLLPGDSFAGKSTLVFELVKLGAMYFSDEYAVLDDNGRVHPYPKPLSVRRNGAVEKVEPAAMGTSVADGSALVRGVLVTQYQPGAVWGPSAIGAGETVLALLSHTVPAQERPADSLRAVTRAVARAWCLHGPRGEAVDVAPSILRMLESAAPPNSPHLTTA